MATQQVLFAETIAGMKKAFKRKAWESDSDSEIESYSNRGHKLKKQARFARKGQLVPTGGPSSYKEAVDYAGVRRSIISRNSPLVDEDGYEVDSADDDERIEAALASAAELNPYANIRIERILAPLTASTDLSIHPTLSKPFTSTTVTDLVSQSSTILRKENQSLWQVRHLWTSLCGDGTWVPCETMVRPNDAELYTEDHVARHLLGLSKTGSTANGSPRTVNGEPHEDGPDERKAATDGKPDGDVAMADQDASEKNGQTDKEGKNGEKEHDTNAVEDKDFAEAQLEQEAEDRHKLKDRERNGSAPPKRTALPGSKPANDKPDVEMAQAGDTAGAGAAAEVETNGVHAPSVASEATAEPFTHPIFLAPAGSKPDRDLGLPENEAEDVRRLLALYIQKQEEVCRGANKLHQGLLRAERLRADVLHWSKAEAHCGPNRDMSDGEDWYDKEEWGLTDDLKKGQDDDEEEPTITTGKKTRARR